MCVCVCVQSRVLSSSSSSSRSSVCVSSDGVLSLDLSSLLSVLSHAESALQRRHKELQVSHTGQELLLLQVRGQPSVDLCVSVCVCQGAELSLRRLGEEQSALQLRLKQLEDDNQQLHTHTQHTQLELTHTLDTLSRYTHTHTHTHTQCSGPHCPLRTVGSFSDEDSLFFLLY